MNQYNFEFTGHPITLKTKEPIKLTLKKALDKYIDFVTNDLVTTVHSSSAKRFNDAARNTLVLLSSEFIEFLNLNVEVFKESAEHFNPFIGVSKVEKENPLFIVDKENNGIVKKASFKINTKNLFDSFVLDKIVNMLLKDGPKSFSVEKNNLFGSYLGEYEEIEYEIDEDLTFKDHLKNEKLSIIFNENIKQKIDSKPKFGTIDEKIKPKFFLIYGDSFVDNRMYNSLLINFTRSNEFRTFAINNDLTFKVIDKKNKTWLFSPKENFYEFNG